MKKSLCLILVGAALGFLIDVGAASEASTVTVIATKIEAALPKSWVVVERKTGALPEGHYWGQEYNGIRGEEVLIQGSADVHVSWQDATGEWRSEVVGK